MLVLRALLAFFVMNLLA